MAGRSISVQRIDRFGYCPCGRLDVNICRARKLIYERIPFVVGDSKFRQHYTSSVFGIFNVCFRWLIAHWLRFLSRAMRSFRSQVSRQDFFNWHPLPSADMDCADGNSEFISPLSERKSLAIECHEYSLVALATVVRLFFAGGPLAVAWAVTAIIFLSLKFHAFRSWPHVSIERLKRLSPSLADCYAATSIVVISGCIGVLATPNHRPPAMVFRAPGLTVCNTSFSGNIRTEASATTLTVTQNFIAKRMCCGESRIPAAAETFPDYQIIFVATGESNDFQQCESFFAKVDDAVVEFRKGFRFGMIDSSHDDILACKGQLWTGPCDVHASSRLALLYHNRCGIRNVQEKGGV